jgi:hypothetical protein
MTQKVGETDFERGWQSAIEAAAQESALHSLQQSDLKVGDAIAKVTKAIRSLRPSPAPPQYGQRDRCTHGELLGECCYQRD